MKNLFTFLKIKIYFILILFPFLLLLSCSDEDDNGGNFDFNGTSVITFTADGTDFRGEVYMNAYYNELMPHDFSDSDELGMIQMEQLSVNSLDNNSGAFAGLIISSFDDDIETSTYNDAGVHPLYHEDLLFEFEDVEIIKGVWFTLIYFPDWVGNEDNPIGYALETGNIKIDYMDFSEVADGKGKVAGTFSGNLRIYDEENGVFIGDESITISNGEFILGDIQSIDFGDFDF